MGETIRARKGGWCGRYWEGCVGGREWGVGAEVDGWCRVEVGTFVEEMGPMVAKHG